MMMKEIKIIGVVGAGQMGRGIAQVAASSGYQTKIFDVSAECLSGGVEFINKQLARSLAKGRITQEQLDATVALISPVSNMADLTECDLVIEAATENREIKFEIFRQLDSTIKAGAILATNTSSISITEIGAVTNRPELVVGMHFMNPVPVMKLVEGIRGLETSNECYDTAAAVIEKMGKVLVTANDMPGFAVNRILMPMINEAVYTLHEGVATAKDIDQAMKLGTNQPMGPLELADFIGLDTCLAIMNVLHDGLGDTKYRPCPLLKQYVAAKRMGRKSGRGFYEYK
jgi:3-hydroxybutyryl-CoA dehydrogenase